MPETESSFGPPFTPVVLPEPEAVGYLNYIGSELKLILAGMLAMESPEALSNKEAHDRFYNLQGGRLVTGWDRVDMLRAYNRSLVPAGVGEPFITEGGTTMRCAPGKAPKVLGFAGALLDLSLQYKQVAWQPLLGQSNMESTLARYNVYKTLVAADGPATSLALQQVTGSSHRSTVRNLTTRLTMQGILTQKLVTGRSRALPYHRAEYRIAPAYRDPVAEFVGRIIALATPPRHEKPSAVEIYGNRARQIFDTPENIRKLVGRAMATGRRLRSLEGKAPGNTAVRQAEEAFGELGVAGAWQIHEYIRLQSGYTYDIRTVWHAIRSLLHSGRLVIVSKDRAKGRTYQLLPMDRPKE